MTCFSMLLFIDIINDCHQLNKLRQKSSNRPTAAETSTAATTNMTSVQPSTVEAAGATAEQSTNAAGSKKPVVTTNQTLTLHDLTHVLDEYGINVKKTFYYT